MVWRQLPKLVPAGSIPVSCSKEKRLSLSRKPLLCFLCKTDAFSSPFYFFLHTWFTNKKLHRSDLLIFN